MKATNMQPEGEPETINVQAKSKQLSRGKQAKRERADTRYSEEGDRPGGSQVRSDRGGNGEDIAATIGRDAVGEENDHGKF